MGWEDNALPWYQRVFRTLRATFAPVETLHAVANGEIAPALRFMLLSALPWMLLWAVIPFTHNLNFGSGFEVTVIADKGALPIELDIVRAMAIGLVFNGLTQLSWAVPFVSLLAAFSTGERPEDPKRAGWRTALYRMWIVPLGMMLFFVVPWALPTKPNELTLELAVLGLQMLPRMLILIHCHVMARYFGANGFGALVVSVIPLIVQQAVGLSLQELAVRLLPVMPAPT
ncbi:MAG TPA: hypothetical protein VI299_26400 [Polyangiales bacterium]